MTGPVVEAAAALAVVFPILVPAGVRALGNRHEQRLDDQAHHRWAQLFGDGDREGTAL